MHLLLSSYSLQFLGELPRMPVALLAQYLWASAVSYSFESGVKKLLKVGVCCTAIFAFVIVSGISSNLFGNCYCNWQILLEIFLGK